MPDSNSPAAIKVIPMDVPFYYSSSQMEIYNWCVFVLTS